MKFLPTAVLIIFLSTNFSSHVNSSIPAGKLLAKGVSYFTKPLGYEIVDDSEKAEKVIEEQVPVYAKFMPGSIKKYFIKRNQVLKTKQKSLVSYIGAGIVGFHLGAASSLALPFGIGAALGAPIGAVAGAKVGTAKGIILSKTVFDNKDIIAERALPLPVTPILVKKDLAKKVVAGVSVALRAAAAAASMAAAPSMQVGVTVGKTGKAVTPGIITTSKVHPSPIQLAKASSSQTNESPVNILQSYA